MIKPDALKMDSYAVDEYVDAERLVRSPEEYLQVTMERIREDIGDPQEALAELIADFESDLKSAEIKHFANVDDRIQSMIEKGFYSVEGSRILFTLFREAGIKFEHLELFLENDKEAQVDPKVRMIMNDYLHSLREVYAEE